MTDRKLSPDLVLRRLLTENEIPWSTDLSGTLYIEIIGTPYCMVSHNLSGHGMFEVGFYTTHTETFEGEEYQECDQEPYMYAEFDRPDMVLRFLKEVNDGSFDNWYMENLEEYTEETNEQHLNWLLQNNPKYVMENHREWFDKKLMKIVQDAYKETENDE